VRQYYLIFYLDREKKYCQRLKSNANLSYFKTELFDQTAFIVWNMFFDIGNQEIRVCGKNTIPFGYCDVTMSNVNKSSFLKIKFWWSIKKE